MSQNSWLRQIVDDLNSVFVSRENRRLLTVCNDLSRSRSSCKNLIFASSLWTQFFVSRSQSLWRTLILASSLWKDLISARSEYERESRYCIQLLYLSENDLSENDYDLLWIRSSEYLEFLEFLVIISPFPWRAGFFRPEELLWDRSFSESTRTGQDRPHLHIS
jgi:hypothetical protein